MRALDLCCGAGGASVGFSRAGFEVVGVDALTQPRYPFEFHQADALTFPLRGFDFVHASPPCQLYSDLNARHRREYPRLIESLRERFIAAGVPYVIENVEGAPLVDPIVLCGTMFPGLRVIRHRLFESNLPLIEPAVHPAHPLVFTHDKRKRHYGRLDPWRSFVQVTGGGNCPVDAARDAMGIGWMTKGELNEAIPPAYTEFVGLQVADVLSLQPHRTYTRHMAERMDDMAEQAKGGATVTTARNRQVISLPADLAERVNAKGREMSEAVKAVTRVDPNLSLTDVAQSLLIQALDAADAEVAAAAENGDKAA